MGRRQTNDNEPMGAMFAFGARVPTKDVVDTLVATNGWRSREWTSILHPELKAPAWLPTSNAVSNDSPPLSGRLVANLSPPAESVLCNTSAVHSRPTQNAATDGGLFLVHSGEFPSLDFVEWHYIDFVLSKLGSISATARVLGIRRSTLQRKRKKNPPIR